MADNEDPSVEETIDVIDDAPVDVVDAVVEAPVIVEAPVKKVTVKKASVAKTPVPVKPAFKVRTVYRPNAR